MLEEELGKFMSDGHEGSHFIEAYVHTKDRDIKVYKVESLDIISDFSSAYTDVIVLVFYMRMSEFIHHVTPNALNLEMTILKTTSKETFKIRTKAVLPPKTANEIGVHSLSKQTLESLDITGLTRVELHGKHVFAEAASTVVVGGNYLNTTLHFLMNKVIKHYMGQVQLSTGETLGDVIITPPNNSRVYEQVLIPSGTALLRVPKMLQEKYGVYTSGIGSYLRPFEDGKSVWWIYPTYGRAVLNSNVPILRVFVFYNKRADVLKNTIQRDKNVVIIAASLIEQDNPVMDTRPAIRPTDVTVVDNERMVEYPSTYKTGEVMINRKDRTKRIGVYDRRDKTELPELSARRTSNMYQASAAVTANMTHTMAFKWVNGIQELLIPGMVVEVFVEHGHEVAKGMGRLATAQSVCVGRGNLAAEPYFTETVIFSVHLDSSQ
jgi:hypothetical protein